jgi:hypothetical protein
MAQAAISAERGSSKSVNNVLSMVEHRELRQSRGGTRR